MGKKSEIQYGPKVGSMGYGVILFLATMSVSAFDYLWIWLFSGMGYHGRLALDSMKVLGKVFLDSPGWTGRMHFWSLCIFVFTFIDFCPWSDT